MDKRRLNDLLWYYLVMTPESGGCKGSFKVGRLFVEYVKPKADEKLHDKPILFVHGAFSGSWCWHTFMDYFSERGWDCYAMNWRGHHKSDRVPDHEFVKISVLDYVEDVEEVAAKVGEPLIIVGHSLGGLVSQKYAERHETAGIILIAPGPPAQVGSPSESTVSTGKPIKIFSREKTKWRYFYKISDEDFERYYSLMCPESPTALNERWTNKIGVDKSKVSHPILVVNAEFDFRHAKVDRNIADYYSADYLYIRGHGHEMFIEEGWEKIAEKIQHWLLKHFPESRA